MRTGAIDQDEIGVSLHPGHRHGKPVVKGVLAGFEHRLVDIWQVVIRWCRQVQPLLFYKVPPVLDVAPECLLPQIQIKRANLMAHPGERRCHMHGDRRFARAALFIADHDNMRHCPIPRRFVLWTTI